MTATVSFLKQESVGKRERKRERDREKTNEELSIIKTRKIIFQRSYTLSFLRKKHQNFANAFLLLMIKIAKPTAEKIITI